MARPGSLKSLFVQRVLFPLARIYWRLLRPKTFGVKGILVHPVDGSVLFVRHAYGDTSIWSLPGGGYRPSRESPERAIVREVGEERGLEVLEALELGTYKTQAQGKRDTVTILLARVADSAPRTNDAPLRGALVCPRGCRGP